MRADSTIWEQAKESSRMAKKKSRRPKGWRKFDDLTRKLIQVPKEEADAQVEAGRNARKASRRKKK